MRRGAALVVVLLALALLFALGVPFLFLGRIRSEAARDGYDGERARVAVESATAAALYAQAASHPAVDPTPLWDAAGEWDPAQLGVLPEALGPEWEKSGQSWGVEAEAEQGRVSLASAPLVLLQSLLHPCFITEDCDYRSTELPVTSTAGFPEEGLLFLGHLWVSYGSKHESSFLEVAPAEEPPEDLTSIRFREGYAVIDPRVYALALGRLRGSQYAAPEFLGDLLDADPLGFGRLPEDDRRRLAGLCTMRAGAYGADPWQPAAYLGLPPDADTPELIQITDATAFSRGTILRLLPEQGEPQDSFVLSQQNGRLLLPSPVGLQFEPFTTRVYPLAREPVDLNSASPDVLAALVVGLRWTTGPPVAPYDGRVLSGSGRDWIRPLRARSFAERVIAARPLQGPDDLWERVLQPWVESGELSDFEALAIALNGLDPNDGRLDQGTLPFGYRSGDRYLQRVDAAVRSPIGATQARAAERQKVEAAPSGPLLRLWRTQQDFEDTGRFGRGLHGMTTLPNNLGQAGGAHDFSDPLTLRCGLRLDAGRMTPSGDEEQSALMPRPARESDDFGSNGYGHSEHFDREPSPLGYDAAAEGAWRTAIVEWNLLPAFTAGVGGGLPSSAHEPLHLQGWFETAGALADGTLFDLAGSELDRSRVVALFEGGDLVVRGYDNAGDDPLDEDNLVQAVETRVDGAEYPLGERWLHVAALLRGIAPRGLQVAVDGVPRGRSNVLTYLSGALAAHVAGSPDAEVFVESTEGFPNRGALRIGGEVIEYSSKTARSFVTNRTQSATGYLGGRAAREGSDTLINSLDSTHPAGAGVELYGYSAVLDSPIPPGGGRLSGEVGTWSIATAVQGEDTIQYNYFDPQTGRSGTIDLGQGIDCNYLGPIELADAFAGDPSYAQAFQSDGGYAFLVQQVPFFNGQQVLGTDGCRVGGVEMVQYSQRQGTQIILSQRSVPGVGLQGGPQPYFAPAPAHFVTDWNPSIVELPAGTPLAQLPNWRVFVVPISIKGSGVSDVTYLPGGQFSQFVQLTHDADAGLTEWVRYDHILNGCFVRDDWRAFMRTFGVYLSQGNLDVPRPNPVSGGGSGGVLKGLQFLRRWDGSGAALPAPEQEGEDSTVFVRRLGQPEPNRNSSLENLRVVFDHRGVLYTYDHPHSQSTRLVPVFRTVRSLDPWSGYVGRLDRVAVMQPGTSQPPFWFTVQWGTAAPAGDAQVKTGVTYVAFHEDPGLPFVAPATIPNLFDANTDVRALPRLVKFPSGERPLQLEQIVIGGDVSGGAGFGGHIDEFSAHATGGMGVPGFGGARGAFVLRQDLSDAPVSEIHVHELPLVKDGRLVGATSAGAFLQLLPPSGLLDIDGERFGYYAIDAAAGVIRLNGDSRGLHGTQRRGHAAGATVWVVDGRPAAALTAPLTPGDAVLNLEPGQQPFPLQGLLLVGLELMHSFYQPGQDPNQRAMPRYRPREGDADRIGDGILRGRFGTTPADHGVGDLVYSFPVRWYDRYVPECDDPAGAWFELGLEEPNAYWRGLRFEAEVPDGSQVVRVLARAGTAQWEDPPGTPGLKLIDTPHADGGGVVPLNFASDRLDLRLSFDWGPGAFDPASFTATGWTTSPRLRRLLVDYLADARVDWRQEVVE